jgi:chemotaxis protein methyltransferase CheR
VDHLDPSSLASFIEPAIRPMTETEFDRFKTFIYEEAGIHLGPGKKDLLAGRLTRRMRELGIRTFREYYHRLLHGDGTERVHCLNAVSTNETHFFREPKHFEFLRDDLIPIWMSRADAGVMPRRLRIWSAACATGEEPYSLAMVALDRLPAASGWDVEIQATDLSTTAVERARAAVWSIAKADEIPPEYLRAYMLRGTGRQQGKMKAGPEIRSMVRFGRVNLNDEAYPLAGPFDVIFCRNVLIYFDIDSKVRVLQRLLNYLAPDGYLFLGQVESVHGLTDRLRAAGPTVYVLADQSIPDASEVDAPQVARADGWRDAMATEDDL